jgi:RNA polymerase sigma factor (sigma-70 family)
MTNFPETRVSLILRLAQSTDVQAWQEFSDVYAPALYSMCRRRGLQPADAEDVAQETLFAVARAIERFEPDRERARFRTWLARITRNMIADFCAGKLKRPLTQLISDSWLQSASSNARCTIDPIDQDFTHEYRTALFQLAARRVQSRVTAITWQAFHDTCIESKPPAETAKRLNMPLGNLYVAKCRVLKLLREEVQLLDATLSGDWDQRNLHEFENNSPTLSERGIP